MADAFDLPVIEDIAGEKVTFAKIDLDDYTLWMAEIQGQRVVRDKALMNEAGVIDPTQRFDVLRVIHNSGANLADIQNAIYTPNGAKRVLRMGLAKASGVSLHPKLNKPEYDAAVAGSADLFKRIPPYRLMELAREVSGLFLVRASVPAQTNQAEKESESESPNPETSSSDLGSESDTSSGM